MKFLLPTIFLFSLIACSVSKNPLRKQIKMLQSGKLKDDTSYVYALPYEKGKGHWIVQGYFGVYSHKERAALDFKMKRGTRVTAARGGVVVRVKEDSDKGGWGKKYRLAGNNVVILHSDGTRAGYWHIQHNGALVKTGYAATPHLHFIVWKAIPGTPWQQMATRFQTSKGIKYLRTWRKYKW